MKHVNTLSSDSSSCLDRNVSIHSLHLDILRYILLNSQPDNYMREVNTKFKRMLDHITYACIVTQRWWTERFVRRSIHTFLISYDHMDGLVDEGDLTFAYRTIQKESWFRDVTHRDAIFLTGVTLSNLNSSHDPFRSNLNIMPRSKHDFSAQELIYFFGTVFKDNVTENICRCSNGGQYWVGLMCYDCFSVSNGGRDHSFGTCCIDVNMASR